MKVRDSKEGCHVMSVETKVNGDSKSKNERSPSLVSLLGMSCRYTRDLCSVLAALVGPVLNIFPGP